MEESPNLMLKFSVCWLHGPPQHRLCSELDTALDIKKIREGKDHEMGMALLNKALVY